MLSGSAWNLTYPHQKHPDGPGCTPCARFLTLSTTSSEVVVHGACCRMSFHLGNHPPLLQNLALGRYLGAAAHCPAPTVTSTSQEGPSTECGHCGFPVGKDYRSRRRAGLRRRKEGKGAKTSLAGGHGRPGAKCESARSQHGRPGRDQGAASACQGVAPTPVAPVAGRRLQRRRDGQRLGGEGLEIGRASSRERV